MTEQKGPTDEVKKTELASVIQSVLWTEQRAPIGGEVGLEVITQFVGNNSEMKIELVDKSGKTLGKYKEKMNNNRFWAKIKVPDDAEDILVANVKLPKHGLEAASNPLIVLPPIEITNLKWDKKEARRGDTLKLTADIKGAQEGAEAEIEIWEHDADEAHDFITKIPVVIKDKKVETFWEFEYHEDTDDIPEEGETEKGYSPPEYFFRVKLGGISADSELLEFKDWIEIELLDEDTEEPIAQEEYIVILPDGKEIKGKLDGEGFAKLHDIPPGKFKVIFPNLEAVNFDE
jgi:hypothetical protein